MNLHVYFKMIVFHDFWNTNHEMGFANHNAADRWSCFQSMVGHLKKGTAEEHFAYLKEFYEVNVGEETMFVDAAMHAAEAYEELIDQLEKEKEGTIEIEDLYES